MATSYATASVLTRNALSSLVLEREDCGFVQSVAGGAICADVVREKAVGSQPRMKHLAGVRYEPLVVQIGFTMAKPIFAWIASSWKGLAERKSGSILDCNEKKQVLVERRFHNARITATVVPTLDAASREPVWLTLELAPEYIEYLKASGDAKGAHPKNPEKILPASGFKLEIDGLDCTKVRKIDSFRFSQEAVENAVGELRDYEKVPAGIDFSDLHLTFAEIAADSWSRWFDHFVVKGNCRQTDEKNGKLTLLSANQQPLATVRLHQLGIYRMGALDAAPGDDKLKLATASLYCERMELEHT
jgi:hypothetical protein